MYKDFPKKSFGVYMLKFLLAFCILYYGTIAWIGITSPGGYYAAFAHHYLDYISSLRSLLLGASKFLLNILGYRVYVHNITSLKLPSGKGVHIGYDCIGYGVIFFWIAFIFANRTGMWNKLRWMVSGVLIIWIVNVLRISLMVVYIKNNWSTPFGLDNHTLFNIAAYAVIFTMIWLFDRSRKKALPDGHTVKSSLNDTGLEQ